MRFPMACFISSRVLILLYLLVSVFTANFPGPIFNDSVIDVKVIAGKTAILPCAAHNKGHHKVRFCIMSV